MAKTNVFLMYPQEMSRMHLFDESIEHNKYKYTPEDFGLIVKAYDESTEITYELLQLNKLLKIYELSTGKDYLMNGDNSHKFYVIINKLQNKRYIEIDYTADVDGDKNAFRGNKTFEGEIIGYLCYNPANFNRRMQYNCRLCLDYFLKLFTNFPKSNKYNNSIGIATASERSELFSFTRAHYYQLIKVYPSLSHTFPRVSDLIDIEKRASHNSYQKVFDMYRKDLD
jgi:hypothetical protein